jgi:FSR family fosmidomycin resistance protein-like MFS transporter
LDHAEGDFVSLMQRRPVAILALSHLASDLSQGALPAMLPLFIAQRHFSYSVAAALVLAISSTSSFLQPLFGGFADRRQTPWLATAGLLMAGISMAVSGIAPSYAWLIAAVALSGLGLAAFHPEGARLIYQVSGHQRSVGMSWFSVGGNLGFAIGPLLTTAVLSWQGLRGSLFLAIPTVLCAALLHWELHRMKYAHGPAPAASSHAKAAIDQWRPFYLLTASVLCRSLVFFAFNTFLPLYWIHVFGSSREMGSSALSVFLFSGAAGTLAGGKLGDRFPRHRVVIACMAASLPLMIAFVAITNSSLALAILAPFGFVLFAPYSVMVVLGQEYLPNRIGTASGVTIGLAGTIGGLGAPGFGALADHYGLHAALAAPILLACFATFLAFFLTPPRSAQTTLRAEQIEVEI